MAAGPLPRLPLLRTVSLTPAIGSAKLAPERLRNREKATPTGQRSRIGLDPAFTPAPASCKRTVASLNRASSCTAPPFAFTPLSDLAPA